MFTAPEHPPKVSCTWAIQSTAFRWRVGVPTCIATCLRMLVRPCSCERAAYLLVFWLERWNITDGTMFNFMFDRTKAVHSGGRASTKNAGGGRQWLRGERWYRNGAEAPDGSQSPDGRQKRMSGWQARPARKRTIREASSAIICRASFWNRSSLGSP